MRELEKPVSRVFRRLRFQRFVTTLIWSLAITFLLVAVLLGSLKALNLVMPGPDWAPFAVAGAVAVLIAALVAVFTGASRLDAAVAIDRVFHLNERLSSALTLPDDLRESPAGQALIADAVRKVADLDVARHLPPAAAPSLGRADSRRPGGAPALRPRLDSPHDPRPRPSPRFDTKALAKQTQALTKKIASQRQAIDKQKFPEAEKLLAQIEKKSDELAKAPPPPRTSSWSS